MAFYEKKLSRQDIYDGYIIHVHKDEVELPDGNTSFREIVDHHGGVCIVAYLSHPGLRERGHTYLPCHRAKARREPPRRGRVFGGEEDTL